MLSENCRSDILFPFNDCFCDLSLVERTADESLSLKELATPCFSRVSARSAPEPG